MKAIFLNHIGSVALQETDPPKIQDPSDVILHVTTAGVCGSDLHIVHGRDPGIRMATIMGHEFVGIVEQRGDAVTEFKTATELLHHLRSIVDLVFIANVRCRHAVLSLWDLASSMKMEPDCMEVRQNLCVCHWPIQR